jgi:hypothetical protein
MSILHLNNRPWEEFNPGNKQHRMWYNDYMRTNTLHACPVRFVMPTGTGSLVDRCTIALANYYLKNEFNAERSVSNA